MTPQTPLHTPYSADTTVDEILDGVDLGGRNIVITGGYSGVGLALTRDLTAHGASVTVPARRPDHARSELSGVPRVEVGELDLGSLDSVRRFTENYLSSGKPLHTLINCAGIMAPPLTRLGEGWESQFATNHLGHFALTNRLRPALVAAEGSRVVAFSSRGHKFSDIKWDDVDWTNDYDRWKAYGQSKTANALFAVELNTLAADDAVAAFSLNPGGIQTNLQRYVDHDDQVQLGWIDEDGNDLITWKTPEQGASTAAWAATSDDLNANGGVYLENCDIADVVDPTAPDAMTHGVHPFATNSVSATRLWELSAKLTGTGWV